MQRGSNENTNALLRPYLSENADLSLFSPSDFTRIALELNTRPWQILDWMTPAQYFRTRVALAA